MGWKQERDSLIAQTLAFVQSVTGKRDEIERPRVSAVDLGQLEASLERPRPPPIEPQKAAVPVQPAVQAIAPMIEPARSTEPPASALTRRPIVQSEMKEEIRARIASFRAHQERFNREREEYFSATLARLKAAMTEQPSSRFEK
jgi:hypothetical protein